MFWAVRHHCFSTDIDFIKRWNTRTPDPRVKELVEALEQLVFLVEQGKSLMTSADVHHACRDAISVIAKERG